MAIVVTLDIMLNRRNMTLTKLCEQMDITYSNLSILKTNKAKAIKLETLSQICEILKCAPGDLLEYMDDVEYYKLYGRDNR
jgi:putative transcriptional regulator